VFGLPTLRERRRMRRDHRWERSLLHAYQDGEDAYLWGQGCLDNPRVSYSVPSADLMRAWRDGWQAAADRDGASGADQQ
jgi:hypothetical protein